MRRKTTGGLGLLLAVLASLVALGKEAFGKEDGTRQMYGVRWHSTLDDAIAAANPRGGEAKPIVWFRVLGDLDGFS